MAQKLELLAMYEIQEQLQRNMDYHEQTVKLLNQIANQNKSSALRYHFALNSFAVVMAMFAFINSLGGNASA